MTPVSNESTSRHDEIAWSPYPTPGRSLSYGGENSQNYAPVASHVAAGSTGPNTVYDQRRSSIHAAGSDMYQPHNAGIATTIPNVESISGTALDPNGPLSAGAVPTQGYGAWQQPTYTYPKSGDGGAYESWYSSSGQAGSQVPSNTDHSPQSVYYASR